MKAAPARASELPLLDRRLAVEGRFGPADWPDPLQLDLPEKVVQFGTGAFLRGFIGHFIDTANRFGRFGGRIVAVESTGSGRAERLNAQQGLYTLAVQGSEQGREVRSFRVIAALSRVIPARNRWSDVLALARSPDLELIVSNTTEAGIVLDESDDPTALPPRSFPGKLTAFLAARARAFDYAAAAAPVVMPCELIENNGSRLESIVHELAERWSLGEPFRSWLGRVRFCNTLVDRIVPGTPEAAVRARTDLELGYRDELLTVCEPYRLFAIEGDAELAHRLHFSACDASIVIAPDIAPYRERKLRLLNGTHTLLAPAALLCGCTTVLSAVAHELAGPLLRQVLLEEIPDVTDVPGADAFAHDVLERFGNPFLRHNLVDITLQQTSKFRLRVVPTLLRHAERHGRVPPGITLGFVALLHYLGSAPEGGPPDDAGAALRALWRGTRPQGPESFRVFARTVCADAGLWGARLDEVPGFADTVGAHLHRAAVDGFPRLLAAERAAIAR